MPPAHASQSVQAPPDRVFAVVADIPNAAGRIRAIEGIEVLAEAPAAPGNLGPVGRGFRWRETRTMFGKKATEDMTITEWDPPRRYAVEARSHGCHYRSAVIVEPDGPGACTLTMTFDATPETAAAKVMMKVFFFMRKQIEKALRTDLQDIKAHAESQPV